MNQTEMLFTRATNEAGEGFLNSSALDAEFALQLSQYATEAYSLVY